MLWWQCCCLRNAKEEYNMERTVKKESHCRRMKRRDLQAQNSKVRESVESNRSDAPEEQETGQASWHTFSYNPFLMTYSQTGSLYPFLLTLNVQMFSVLLSDQRRNIPRILSLGINIHTSRFHGYSHRESPFFLHSLSLQVFLNFVFFSVSKEEYILDQNSRGSSSITTRKQ